MVLNNNGTTNYGVFSGTPVSGGANWKTYRLLNLSGNVRVTSSQSMAVGFFGGRNVAGAAGYFSGFKPDILADIEFDSIVCQGDLIPIEFTGTAEGNVGFDWDISGATFSNHTVNQTNGSSSSEASASWDTPGTYPISLTLTLDDCEETITKMIQVVPVENDTTYLSDCDSVLWNNVTYSESGTYTSTTLNSNGCEDIDVLVLDILNSTSSSQITACDELIWNNLTINQSGTYTFQTQNMLGCDSTAILNATINYSDTSFSQITACDELIWNDQTITQSGT